ncbi:MAG: hypothetical protein ACR2HJ_06250 [Fimbriimonadales bacterium]
MRFDSEGTTNLAVVILAFLQRVLNRPAGAFQYPIREKNVEPRAARYLKLLEAPPQSLGYKIALENLRREWYMVERT